TSATSRQACACPGYRTAVNAARTWWCLRFANPAGKTYGSPCSAMYGKVTEATLVTRRVARPNSNNPADHPLTLLWLSAIQHPPQVRRLGDVLDHVVDHADQPDAEGDRGVPARVDHGVEVVGLERAQVTGDDRLHVGVVAGQVLGAGAHLRDVL